MITFPEGFIALKYPGYFWHKKTQTVFSIKSGILKPLRLNRLRVTRNRGKLNFKNDPNFCISISGRRVRLFLRLLKTDQYQDTKQEIRVCSFT